MNHGHLLSLLREVLDHEIVDVEGVSCGMVDDIELGDVSREGPVVRALLVGPGAWGPRMPALLQVIADQLFGRKIVRVPWEEVEAVTETIKLKSTAGALGLGRVDRKASRWLSPLPRS
jgi:sporulation protein YlmC with PRC-barrel domain